VKQTRKIFTLFILFAAIAVSWFLYQFHRPETTPTEQDPKITIVPTPQQFYQETMFGDVNDDHYIYQTKILGLEFKIPKITKLSQLIEFIDKKNSDPQASTLALNYCLTDGVKDYGIQSCPIDNFAISTYTRGESVGKSPVFSDIISFTKGNKSIAVTLFTGKNRDISPSRIYDASNSHRLDILKIIGEKKFSEILNHDVTVFGTPGEGYIGAIVNLPDNPTYSGFTIKMKLTDTLTEQVFDQILDSIRVIR